jgi:2'-5' RNA ligase
MQSDRPSAPLPVIITLAVDTESQAHLDTLRRKHFPSHRNMVGAHITLFHALDGMRQTEIIGDLKSMRIAPFVVVADGLRSLGRGVAISIHSEELRTVRTRLASRWMEMLTPQDRQGFRPHVTVQNKVEPAEARALMAAWQPDFLPFVIEAAGLSAWQYLGGPWRLIDTIPFATGVR